MKSSSDLICGAASFPAAVPAARAACEHTPGHFVAEPPRGNALRRALHAVKRAAKRTLVGSGVLRGAARVAPAGAVVLIYHSVRHDPREVADTIGGCAMSAATFRRQMDILARQFHPVSLDDVARFLREGTPLPRRAVVVTFDDGFRDNHAVAAPILQRYGIPGTFFITAGSVESGMAPWFCRVFHAFRTTRVPTWTNPLDGRTWNLAQPAERLQAQMECMGQCAVRAGQEQETAMALLLDKLETADGFPGGDLMLRWPEVQTLQRAGHCIGAHTMSHPNLAHLPAAAARRELLESRCLLELRLESPVRYFSYPCAVLWPHWTAETTALAAEAGYELVATTATGIVRRHCDPHLLPRVAAADDVDEFRWAVEANFLGHRT